MLLEHGGSLDSYSIVSIPALYAIAEGYRPVSIWYRPILTTSKNQCVFCAPSLLAAERRHFKLLDSCRIGGSHGHRWEFVMRRTTATQNARFSYASDHMISGASKGSSTLDHHLDLAGSIETHRDCTLLMWAAASLRLDLIDYLLARGASIDATDRSHRAALHHAILPFADADSCDGDEWVHRLIDKFVEMMKEGQLSLSTASQLLLLLVDVDKSVLDLLDPRIRRSHGVSIHANGIAAIFQNSDHRWEPVSRQDLSRDALYLVIERDMNPACVYEVLCKHGEWYAPDHSTMLAKVLEDEFVPEIVVSKLLENGADPNARLSMGTPLSTAVRSQLPGTIIKLLLEHGADPDLGDGLKENTESHHETVRHPRARIRGRCRRCNARRYATLCHKPQADPGFLCSLCSIHCR